MKTAKPYYKEYNPVDGKFFLVFDSNNKMFAKVWTKEDAEFLINILQCY